MIFKKKSWKFWKNKNYFLLGYFDEWQSSRGLKLRFFEFLILILKYNKKKIIFDELPSPTFYSNFKEIKTFLKEL